MNTRGRFATFWLGPNEVAEPEQRSAGNPNGDGMLPGIIPPLTTARTTVSLSEALSVSAVYASVSIINNWVSQFELLVYKISSVDAEYSGHQLMATPSLIKQPDTETNQYHFIKQTVISLALTGNAYWKVTRRQSDGVPIALEVLNPMAMVVFRNEAGKTMFKYSGFVGDPKEYTARNVVHLMTFEVPGRLTGLSPVEANGGGLVAELLLKTYSEGWFGEGGGVRQHFSVDHQLDEDELVEYIRHVREQKSVGNGDLVTDGGTTIENLQLSPADAMFIEMAQFSKTDIACTWFGIPAGLVGASVDGNSMTYSNLQTDAKLFITNTLMGYMQPIEHALSELLPRGQEVRFDTEGLLRADTQNRYESYATAIAAGFMTVDEARNFEGWHPLETPAEPAAPIAKETQNAN